jgi:phytoene dehydrogenase-like protein
MATAVVVGSGPNGLAGAVRLAQHGIDVEVLEAADQIGGGTRTSELTLPGVLHDHCSAFHPMGVGCRSATLGLATRPLALARIDCAHPRQREAGLLWRSVDETAAGLGPDGGAMAEIRWPGRCRRTGG